MKIILTEEQFNRVVLNEIESEDKITNKCSFNDDGSYPELKHGGTLKTIIDEYDFKCVGRKSSVSGDYIEIEKDIDCGKVKIYVYGNEMSKNFGGELEYGIYGKVKKEGRIPGGIAQITDFLATVCRKESGFGKKIT